MSHIRPTVTECLCNYEENRTKRNEKIVNSAMPNGVVNGKTGDDNTTKEFSEYTNLYTNRTLLELTTGKRLNSMS